MSARPAILLALAAIPLPGAEVAFQARPYRALPGEAPGFHPAAVRVAVTAGEEPFEGEVVVRPLVPADGTIALPTRKRVSVAPRTTKRFDLPVFPGTSSPVLGQGSSPFEVRLVEGGRVVKSTRIRGRGSLLEDAFRAEEIPRIGPNYSCDLAPYFGRPSGRLGFPRAWWAYCGRGRLCLLESEVASMGPEEYSPLWEWTAAGGRTVIAFDARRPWQASPPFPFRLGPLRGAEEPGGTGRALRRAFEVPAGAVACGEPPDPVGAVTWFGAGVVGYLARDPRRGPLPWPAASQVIGGMDRGPISWGANPMEARFRPSAPIMGRAYRLVPWRPESRLRIPTTNLLLYLCAVFAILGPGEALLLRLLRRRPWTWWSSLLLVLGLSSVAVVGAYRFRPGRLKLQTTWVAGIFRSAPYAAGMAATSLFSDGNRRYDIAFPQGALPACLDVASAEQGGASLVWERRPRIAGLFVPTWTWARFTSRWVAARPAGIRAVVAKTGEAGTLRIGKPEGMALEAGLFFRDDKAWLVRAPGPGTYGEIPLDPGRSMAIDEQVIYRWAERFGLGLRSTRLGHPIARISMDDVEDFEIGFPLQGEPVYVAPVTGGAELLFRPTVEGRAFDEEVRGLLAVECEVEP